jgi:hypothetical protein
MALSCSVFGKTVVECLWAIKFLFILIWARDNVISEEIFDAISNHSQIIFGWFVASCFLLVHGHQSRKVPTVNAIACNWV